MTKATIYHNPRCSKSRQTLALLQENNCDITIVEYLTDTLDTSEISKLLSMLNVEPRAMMRTKEDEYKAQNLADKQLSESQLIAAMFKTPKLIERPIVVVDNKAVIGRPPENILQII